MVFLATQDQDSAAVALKGEFSQIADPVNFKVGFEAMSDINRVHSQLSSPHALTRMDRLLLFTSSIEMLNSEGVKTSTKKSLEWVTTRPITPR